VIRTCLILTQNIECQRIEAGPVLAGLLDLLDLANMWGIPDLRFQTESTIVSLQLIRMETWDTSECPEFVRLYIGIHASDLVRERASASQATRLVDACRKTQEANAWAGTADIGES